jgi:hypothetical protein
LELFEVSEMNINITYVHAGVRESSISLGPSDLALQALKIEVNSSLVAVGLLDNRWMIV